VKRVVTFGEMLLRLSPPRYEQFFASPAMTTNFGGCEANVAVGLAQLGVPAAYVTVLPDTPIGDAALAALRAEGVDTAHVVRAEGRLGVYFVELGTEERATRVVYDRAHSAFAESRQPFVWDDVLSGASWFHGSGITAALGPGPATVLKAAVDAARAARVPVSIDLNYRPALWQGRAPQNIVEPVVRGIDLLIGNARAVREMLAVHAGDDVTATAEGALGLARHLAAELGVSRVALTRREMPSETRHRWSASLYDETTQAFAQSRVYDVHVVDRVGGGDSFAAALIAALLNERPLAQAVEFATAAGALKLSVPGDFSRATPAQIEQAMSEWK